MKKLTLLLLLLMISTNVMSEWTIVGSNDVGDGIYYIDYETIKKKGNKVKLWSLVDTTTVKHIPKGSDFLSSTSHFEYDCEEQTRRFLDVCFYSKNMQGGKIVFSAANIKTDTAESIIPNSMDDVVFKIACGKK